MNTTSYNECMLKNYSYKLPSKIICLTEESVETLYLINRSELIAGVSSYVKRPEAAQSLPKVSLFNTSNYKKIQEIKPDLILGYSDIQKDIARDLIEMGFNVQISNHRTLQGILDYIYQLGLMVDAKSDTIKLIDRLLSKINEAQEFTKNLQRKPKIYFEEWDEPRISAIGYVSELIELCGGISIYDDNSRNVLAKDRIVEDLTTIELNPDLIIGCWCGKKVRIDKITQRAGYDKIAAVKKKNVIEVEPEIFLQPGPALLTDGIDIMMKIIKEWSENYA